MVATAPILIPSAIATAAEINWAARSVVSASSYRDAYVPDKVKDRVVSDASRWLAAEHDKNPWLELAFSEPITVGMIDVFSGWNKGDSLQAFDVLLEVDGAWQRHADWEIRENTKTAKRVYIDRTNVSKIRLVHLKPTAGRIREIAVYDNKEAQGLKDVGEHGSDAEAYEISLSQHQIGLNQIGYLTKRPKAFYRSFVRRWNCIQDSRGSTRRLFFSAVQFRAESVTLQTSSQRIPTSGMSSILKAVSSKPTPVIPSWSAKTWRANSTGRPQWTS